MEETTVEAAPEAAGGPPRRGARPAALLGTVVAVLVVAALVMALVEWSSNSGRADRLQSADSLRRSAQAAGARYGVYLSSYDYSDLDGPSAPWTEVDQHSTPGFRTDFDKTKANLSKLVQDYKAKATGTVLAAGASEVDPGRAVVLLFIDQKITNSAQKPGTTVQPLRVEVVLARQHGVWLIDKLEVPT